MKISDFKTKAWQHKGKARKYRKATESKTDLSYMLAEQYLQVLANHAPPGAKVLDMGCGTGVISMALADMGYQVTAVDVSNEMLDELRQGMGARSIELSRGDIFSLPVADDSFDAIISRWVLPHFPQWPLAVQEAAKKLKPGGALLFDICSADNVELAAEAGRIPASFGYNFDQDAAARGYYAQVTRSEVELVAQTAGLTLQVIRPLGFFRANAVIAASMGDSGYAAFRTEMERFFQSEEVNEFIRWFESEVTPRLPLTMATEAIVVMTKPSSPTYSATIASGLKAWVARWIP
jgi:ubiquinone/menaquinone biosynthesis C-methylase UbiE